MTIYTTEITSPISKITLASDGENLIGLWFENQKYFLCSIKEELIPCKDLEIFKHTKHWLERYFIGEQPPINELSLAPRGSSFRQEVWEILQEIPYGEVTTYGEIAKKLALKHNKAQMSPQAVGGAVGHNPISIIIPCHRVIGSNGSLTGYAGGLDIKRKLLNLEGYKTPL